MFWFGMGVGPHFAPVCDNANIHNKKIVDSKGLSPLAGSGAEPRLNNNDNLSLIECGTIGQ